MIFYIIVAALAAVFLVVVLLNGWMTRSRIRKHGLETDATVTRAEWESSDLDGMTIDHLAYYVRYRNREGKTVSSRLLNPPRSVRQAQESRGMSLRIRYLPGKPRYALAVEDESSSSRETPRLRLFAKPRMAKLEAEIRALEAELKTLDGQSGDPAALAELDAQRAALRARIRTLSDEWARLYGAEE